jgi:pilus assembly protein CpaC
VSGLRQFAWILAPAVWLCAPWSLVAAADDAPAQQQNTSGQNTPVEKWTVTVGKSLIMDSPLPIERLSVADGSLADAVAIGPKEVLINGKTPGETSLIVWQKGGSRLIYDLAVRPSPARLEAVRQQLAREYPDDEINVTFDNDTVFVRGDVKDVVAAARVMAIASTLGKPVNLLRVEVPPSEAQILVKVRFANVDRSASLNLEADLASGAFNQSTAGGVGSPVSTDGTKSFNLSSAVNFFLFRKDINLIAALQLLASKSQLEMLAEPTVPAINGKQAFFTAGGEFPFPMVQPGAAGTGAVVTLSWREYGVRLNFLPIITPRGTIRLQVQPEVSSLDYTHAVTISGFTVPALSTRKVQTEIELESGQSFVIAGLIDNQTSESFSKVPGIGDIPILGKLFQSKNVTRNNTELLVIVTPEIVRPIPADQAVPELNFDRPFLAPHTDIPMRQPGMDKTGPVPVNPPAKTIPIEQLLQQQKQGQPDAAPNPAQYQLVPVAPPATPPAGTAGSAGTGK